MSDLSALPRKKSRWRTPAKGGLVTRENVPRQLASAGGDLRIVPRRDGLTIRSAAFFQDPAGPAGRSFLFRVFRVPQVDSVEIDREKSTARLRFAAGGNTPEVWRHLKQALCSADGEGQEDRDLRHEVNSLFLGHGPKFRVRVGRAGSVLSTWRVVSLSRSRIRLKHPALRNRRDVAYRLEEELTAIFGVRHFRTNVLTGSAVIHLHPGLLNHSRLLRHLESAWPRLIDGLEGPPPTTRFFASFSMMGLAFSGQYLFPPLLPFALAAVAVYGFPNVINALKQVRRGQVALPVLYTGTLTFTLLSGMPFSATLMASFMQLWPRWGYEMMTKSQRRLFANHRQRATWARLLREDGTDVEVNIDRLKAGDLIEICEEEVVPVDGVITGGLAAVDEEALTGRAGAFDKAPGDKVFAASFVRAGRIIVRVEEVGEKTLAGHIGTQLPHGRISHLPSAAEAEKLANGMVAPTLALSGINLLLTGEVQPSQSTLRPDYATSPRLGAQLGALRSLSDGLRRGILFRDPAALDRLPATDIYVFDDTAALERRRIAVGHVIPASGISAGEVLSYAASAFPSFQNERARALLDECVKVRVPLQEISDRERHAGVISYRDSAKRTLQVASPDFVRSHKVRIPSALAGAVAASPSAWAERGSGRKPVPHVEPQLRPLWVIRDGKVLGAVTFQRAGEYEAVEVIATLRARNANARFVHVSRHPQERARALADQIGISTAFGGLGTKEKADLLERLGRRTMWIGDGTLSESADLIAASTISISLAGAPTVRHDAANVVLLQPSVRGLVPLRHMGRRHRALLQEGYRSVFAANLFCVGGAFVGDFTTLTVALVSNFGTGIVYSSHQSQLNSLVARMERKMGTKRSLENEDYESTDNGSHELERRQEAGDFEGDVPAPSGIPI